MSIPINIFNQQPQIDMMVQSFQGPQGPQGNGLTEEQIQASIDATKAANDAAAKADAAREGIEGEIGSLKDTKADAILDTSARAASHTLHAQRGRIAATLYGATTETGSGDKSPYNPYTISGIDRATVSVGGAEHDLPLLPDGSPLMGNGTVDDTVENDVLSGCDKKIVLDGTQAIRLGSVTGGVDYRAMITIPNMSADVDPNIINPGGCDRLPIISPNNNYNKIESIALASTYAYVYIAALKNATVDEWKAYLAANPLTVFYRSTDYTPEKELRVCRVTRRKNLVVFDGTEKWIEGTAGNSVYYLYENLKPSKVNGGFENTRFKTINQVVSYGNSYIAGSNKTMLLCYMSKESAADLGVWKSLLADWYAEEKPLAIAYELATPEVYMSASLPLRKPDTLASDTVTVTGSAETAVEYPHDTKHYTDQQHDSLARAVENNAEAVNSLSEDVAELTAGYELIKTITLTAEQAGVAQIVETFDGKTYDGMIVSVANAAPGWSVSAFCGFGEIGLKRAVGGDLFWAGIGTGARYICRNVNGVWDVHGYQGGLSDRSTALGQVSVHKVSLVGQEYAHIGYVCLYTFSAGGFPGGTEVKFYGKEA